MSEITLYTCNCDRKKLVKYDPTDQQKPNYLHKIVTVNFDLKEPSTVVNPVIVLSKTHIGDNWSQINYAYIPSFNRYYFIDTITCENNGLLRMELHVDVLQTYQAGLRSTPFEIARSESVNSKYFIDPEKALIQRRVVRYIKAMSNGASAGVPQSASNTTKYFITVAGG